LGPKGDRQEGETQKKIKMVVTIPRPTTYYRIYKEGALIQLRFRNVHQTVQKKRKPKNKSIKKQTTYNLGEIYEN
jgi:hypothetical protein